MAIGWAAYVTPVVLVPLGALIVTRSALVEVGPFRLGLPAALLGLMLTLGRGHGGLVGKGLERIVAMGVGGAGSTMLGVLLAIGGLLLLTGASLGAIVRRSGRAVRRASTVVRSLERRPPPRAEPRVPEPESFHVGEPIVDAVQDYPDLVAASAGFGPDDTLLDHGFDDDDTQQTLFEVTEPERVYVLPDRGLLKRSKPGMGPTEEASGRVAAALVQCLANFGVAATVIGEISGPRVTRYELQLAPGTKVAKVAQLKDDLSYALATTEIRILAPIPGKQAVGVEVPNLSPNLVTLGDIYDDLPGTASPLSVWLGKDISGAAVWTDLARMPHILIAGTTGSGKSGCINTILTSILLRDTRRGAADPDRPEAHRAQLLRVDPAPADARRLEPEGGERRPPERRDRDGAPLRPS